MRDITSGWLKLLFICKRLPSLSGYCGFRWFHEHNEIRKPVSFLLLPTVIPVSTLEKPSVAPSLLRCSPNAYSLNTDHRALLTLSLLLSVLQMMACHTALIGSHEAANERKHWRIFIQVSSKVRHFRVTLVQQYLSYYWFSLESLHSPPSRCHSLPLWIDLWDETDPCPSHSERRSAHHVCDMAWN